MTSIKSVITKQDTLSPSPSKASQGTLPTGQAVTKGTPAANLPLTEKIAAAWNKLIALIKNSLHSPTQNVKAVHFGDFVQFTVRKGKEELLLCLSNLRNNLFGPKTLNLQFHVEHTKKDGTVTQTKMEIPEEKLKQFYRDSEFSLCNQTSAQILDLMSATAKDHNVEIPELSLLKK